MANTPRNHSRQFMLIGGPLHGVVHELRGRNAPPEAVALEHDGEFLWYELQPGKAIAEFKYSEPVKQ